MTRQQSTPRIRNSLLLLDTRWPNDVTISVDIDVEDGHKTYSPKYLVRLFKDCAASWTRGTNLKLDFNSTAIRKDVRVKMFIVNNGQIYAVEGWSALGTDATDPTSYPVYSMELKLGSRASFIHIRRTMLHEIGHALGLEHEHTHPDRAWKWNKHAVYDYYGVTMRGITKKQRRHQKKLADENVLLQYNNGECALGVRECDGVSVMMYKTEPNWIAQGTGVYEENNTLSVGDTIGIQKHYPPRSKSPNITLARKSSSARHRRSSTKHKRRAASTSTRSRRERTGMRPDMWLYNVHIKCLRQECAPEDTQCDECRRVSREYVDAHYLSSNDDEADGIGDADRVLPVSERR
jgi:hypothetical protein